MATVFYLVFPLFAFLQTKKTLFYYFNLSRCGLFPAIVRSGPTDLSATVRPS